MEILTISPGNLFSTYGGGQAYVRNYIDELIKQGSPIVIASPCINEIGDENYKGCKVVYFRSAATVDDALQIISHVKPDIVHIHGFKAIFAEACRKLNIPCIITAHHGGILCPAGSLLNYREEICWVEANHTNCLPCVLKNIRGGIYSWPLVRNIPLRIRLMLGKILSKLPFVLYLTPVLTASSSIQHKGAEWQSIYKNASLIIAPSKAIARSMIINGAYVEKVKVLPHGIPLPKHLKISGSTTVVGKPLKFFYVGRICYVKGIHIMLSAFNELSINAELNIIGGAGNRNEERYMRRLKNKYKNDARIKWHGKISSEDILDEIDKYDVLIHPTICLEVFGLNIAEALAMGRLVIATRCGGPEMQILDGINGILVNPNSASEIKEAILKLVKKEISLNPGKKEVITINEHVTELQRIYEEIAN